MLSPPSGSVRSFQMPEKGMLLNQFTMRCCHHVFMGVLL